MSAWPRRWLILGLASAVLNVFLIGFLAGRHAFGPAGCGTRGFRHDNHGAFAKRIPEGDRTRLREKLEGVRSAREQVRDALLNDPYQPAQLEAALTRLRERSAELQLDMHRQLLETAGHMPVEQRRRLAESRFMRPPLGP
ncbi:MAG TPA: periplasmic heavy metal sensor [Polyangiales bacterium]|nr:periplasmic heavy metal sensor [Polyangiales bacterium]